MSPKKLVKITNIIGITATVLLTYWVFAFILIQVFGLRVFQRGLTEMFGLSIMGIIALMAGALMLNIMLNLTRIAERQTETAPLPTTATWQKRWWCLLAVFPLIAIILFGGNYLTVQQKQRILIASATNLVQAYPQQAKMLAQYRFEPSYLAQASELLALLEKRDTAFKTATVIVRDQVNGNPVWLDVNRRDLPDGLTAQSEVSPIPDGFSYSHNQEVKTVRKTNYMLTADLPTREYLQTTFDNNGSQIRFKAKDGNYELFYPYQENGKTIAVFYFSDYQRYGKFGQSID